MDINKDDVGVIATVVAWISMIFIGGRGYEKLSSRVESLEKKAPCVPIDTCDERRSGCSQKNQLQFEHGSRLFDELKDLIAANREEAQTQHREVMQILREMKK